MIYLILTQAGFEEAKDLVLEHKAMLWINNDVLSDIQLNELTTAGITIHTLSNKIDPNNEKPILAVIEMIENDNPDTELLVEYQ